MGVVGGGLKDSGRFVGRGFSGRLVGLSVGSFVRSFARHRWWGLLTRPNRHSWIDCEVPNSRGWQGADRPHDSGAAGFLGNCELWVGSAARPELAKLSAPFCIFSGWRRAHVMQGSKTPCGPCFSTTDFNAPENLGVGGAPGKKSC